MNGNEKKENIEMIVIADNSNAEDVKRSDSSTLFHNNFNSNTNNSINDNNSSNPLAIAFDSSDFIDRMATNTAMTTTTSVIDLEVDVHHRNSSGSSIGTSERSKGQREAITSSEVVANSGSSLTTSTGIYVPNGDFTSKLNSNDNNEVMSQTSAGSDVLLVNKTNEMIESSDVLLKGTSLELGFMAQDPAALRAQVNRNDSQSDRKRADTVVVRRARSELETKVSSDKMLSSLPPSHPVSLEVIGTTRRDSDCTDVSNNDSESLLRRASHNPNDTDSQSNQQNIDSMKVLNSPDLKTSHTMKSSPVLSELRTQKSGKESQVLAELESTSHSRQNKSSDCDDGDESDVSLVVNLNKVKKRKVQKISKPRRTLNRRKVSKSVSSGKISSNKKLEKVLQFSDNTTSSNELNKRCVQTFSSESDIESSHNGSDSYTSHSSSSLSSSHSSIAETTPLTACLVNESENRSNVSNSHHNSIALEPKCIAGPSRQSSYDTKHDYLKRPNIHSRNESQEFGHNFELKVLRNELQRKKKRNKRSDPNASSHHSIDPSEVNNENIAGALELPQNAVADNGPPPYMLARILSTPGTHLAKSHEDTNIGAVHVFQDERGNWLTYTFDEKSTGVARGLMNSDKALLDIELYSAVRAQAGHHKWNSSSSSSGSTVVLESPANVLHTPKMLQTGLLHSQFGDTPHDFSRVFQPNANSLFAESFPSES